MKLLTIRKNKTNIINCLSIFLFFIYPLFSNTTIQFVDEDTKQPISAVKIYFNAWDIERQADERGILVLTNMIPTPQKTEIVVIDNRYNFSTISITLSNNVWVNLSLKKLGVSGTPAPATSERKRLHEVVIKTQRDTEKVTKKTISRATLSDMPMIIDDPLVINRIYSYTSSTAPLASDTFIRGSYHQNYYLDHAPVANPYHLFNLSSILSAQLVDYMEIYPSGAGVDLVSGHGMVQKIFADNLQRERVSGEVDINLVYAGLYLNVPLGENVNVLFSGRRSYVDLLLKNYLDKYADITFEKYPTFYDLYTKVTYNPNNRHRISLSGFYAGDLAKINNSFSEDSVISYWKRETFITSFFGAMTYLYSPSEKFQNRITTYYSHKNLFEFTESLYDDKTNAYYLTESRKKNNYNLFHFTDHLYYKPNDLVHLYAGVGYEYNDNTIYEKDIVLGTNGSYPEYDYFLKFTNKKKERFPTLEGYTKIVFQHKDFQWDVGVRAQRVLSSGLYSVLPRFGVQYSFGDEKLVLSGRYGKYSQLNGSKNAIDSDQFLVTLASKPNRIHNLSVDLFYNNFEIRKKIKFFDGGIPEPGKRIDIYNKWWIAGVEMNYSLHLKRLSGILSYGYNYVWDEENDHFHKMHRPIILKTSIVYRPNERLKIALLEEIFSGERFTPLKDVSVDGEFIYGKTNSSHVPLTHYMTLELEYVAKIARISKRVENNGLLSNKKSGKLSFSLRFVNLYGAKFYQDVNYDRSIEQKSDIEKGTTYWGQGVPSGFPLPNICVKYSF